MATFSTDLYTEQSGFKDNRHYRPEGLSLSAPLRVFKPDNYVAAGTEAAADVINLGFPRSGGARFLPVLCRVSNPTGTSNFTCSLKLQKVDKDGNVTDMSAATDIANSSVALNILASAAENPQVAHDDYLRFLIANNSGTSGVSIAAGQELVTELVFFNDQAP